MLVEVNASSSSSAGGEKHDDFVIGNGGSNNIECSTFGTGEETERRRRSSQVLSLVAVGLVSINAMTTAAKSNTKNGNPKTPTGRARS